MAAARSTSLSGASGSTRCRSSRLCEVRSKNGSGSISRSLASGSRSAWYSIAEDGATVSHTRLSSGLGQARSASPTSRKLMRLLVTSRAGFTGSRNSASVASRSSSRVFTRAPLISTSSRPVPGRISSP